MHGMVHEATRGSAGNIVEIEKPLYGLDDASRKFYLKLKEKLIEMGLKTLPGDEALYYQNEK